MWEWISLVLGTMRPERAALLREERVGKCVADVEDGSDCWRSSSTKSSA